MNFILVNFSFLAYSMMIYGTIICLGENKLPSFMVKTFRYGKFAYRGSLTGLSSKIVLEVPKSWFRHFYWSGILAYVFILYQISSVYVLKNDVPTWLNSFLNIVCGPNRFANGK